MVSNPRFLGALINFCKISTPFMKTETMEEEKLRDVLQEREGTSLNYWEVFSNYIGQFSWSISVYLALSRTI